MKPHLFRRNGVWYCGMRGYGPVGSGHGLFHAFVEWKIRQ